MKNSLMKNSLMINSLTLNNEEYLFFKNTCSHYLHNSDILKNDDGTFSVLLDDVIAILCEDHIGDVLAYDGFDENYNVKNNGLLCESILDKFYDQLVI